MSSQSASAARSRPRARVIWNWRRRLVVVVLPSRGWSAGAVLMLGESRLAKELEFPDAPSTDYNLRPVHPEAEAVNGRTITPDQMATVEAHIAGILPFLY